MVSLWGSKNEEERQENEDTAPAEHSRQQQSSQGREPDERTRLLPPRNEGYLDPSDPAVGFSEQTTFLQQSLLTRLLNR